MTWPMVSHRPTGTVRKVFHRHSRFNGPLSSFYYSNMYFGPIVCIRRKSPSNHHKNMGLRNARAGLQKHIMVDSAGPRAYVALDRGPGKLDDSASDA